MILNAYLAMASVALTQIGYWAFSPDKPWYVYGVQAIVCGFILHRLWATRNAE